LYSPPLALRRVFGLQEIGVEVWDWDAGSDDEKIGRASVLLGPLADGDGKLEAWYDVIGQDGQPVWGEDGSKTIVKIVVEKNVDPSDVGISMKNVVPDPDEIKVLDCTKEPWESARRGIMFDIENHSDYPVRIKRFWVRTRGRVTLSTGHGMHHRVHTLCDPCKIVASLSMPLLLAHLPLCLSFISSHFRFESEREKEGVRL
jgi:hypothetical protein